MLCKNCGYDEQMDGAAFCTRCGEPLEGIVPGVPCPHCGLLLPADFSEPCPKCGVFAESGIEEQGRQGWTAFATREGALGGLLSLGTAVVLTVGFFVLVDRIVKPGSFARMMLSPGGVLSGVPWSIQFTLFWSMSILLLRWWQLRHDRSCLRAGVAKRIAYAVGTHGIDSAVEKLRKSNYQDQLRVRLRRLLQQARISRGTGQLQDFVRLLSDLDRDRIASAYTLPRLFIWCMPVLGFIGTVIGISIAVGKFSGFLGGEITKTDVIVQKLAEVTGGLSYAFYTTLHGLLAALLAMIPTSWLQKAEEDFVSDLDQACIEELVPEIAKSSGALAP